MSVISLSLRYTLRALARKPSFAALVILVLASAIGLSTALFAIGNATFIRPLSYSDADELVQLWPETLVNKRLAFAVSSRQAVFAACSPYLSGVFPLRLDRDAVTVKGARVGVDHFRVLGGHPLLGRSFIAEDGKPGSDKVVVLSEGLWRRGFGADKGILSRTVSIDGDSYQVVGVMPQTFRPLDAKWEIWLPLIIDPGSREDFLNSFYLKVVARLQPAVTDERARQELHRIVEEFRSEYPNLVTDELIAGSRVASLQEVMAGPIRSTFLLLVGAVTAILLIACANVANLLLVRALQRQRLVAIQAALGAGRTQIIGSLLLESVTLGLIGGLVGVGFSVASLRILLAFLPLSIAQYSIDLDGLALAFNVGLSLSVTAILGLGTASRALRLNLQGELRDGGQATAGLDKKRIGRNLVTGQVALACALLIGAGLLLRSIWQLQDVTPGFALDDRLIARVDLPKTEYREPTLLVETQHRILREISAQPGILQVGAIHLLPLTADNWSFPYMAEGQPRNGDTANRALPEANFRIVTPNYFKAMGIELIEGRAFAESDQLSSASVGLINRTMAHALWPGRSAVGRKIQLFGDGGPDFIVVGVVDDIHQHRLSEKPRPEMYRPYTQWPNSSIYLVVVTHSNDPETLVPTVRAAVRQVDPGIPVSEVSTTREVFRTSFRDERVTCWLIGLFAAVALLLAMMGIYGVTSYGVEQRLRDMGIRMALGARRQQVLLAILKEGLGLATAGTAVGVILALTSVHLLPRHLFMISVYDEYSYISVALIVFMAALISTWWPARRASAVDLVSVLKLN
jgi:putative ABC transport system permease protein